MQSDSPAGCVLAVAAAGLCTLLPGPRTAEHLVRDVTAARRCEEEKASAFHTRLDRHPPSPSRS